MTKAIRNCFGFGFTLLRSVIGQEKSHHALDQSDVRPKSILIFPRFWQFAGFYHAFSLAPHCIFPSSDRPLRLLCFWSYDPKSRSALLFSLLRLTSTQVVKRDYYYANVSIHLIITPQTSAVESPADSSKLLSTPEETKTMLEQVCYTIVRI